MSTKRNIKLLDGDDEDSKHANENVGEEEDEKKKKKLINFRLHMN